MSMWIGFKRIKIQPLNADGTPDGDLIVIEGKADKGATQEATITGLSPESIKVWGSDGVYYISQKGTGDINVALKLLDVPSSAEDKILGYQTDEELGAQFIGKNTEPPYCAITLESSDAQGNVAMFGFFKGKFSCGDVNLKSKEGANFTPEGAQYTYSVIASDKEDKSKENSMVKFLGTQEKKEAVEKLVLGTADGGESKPDLGA